MKTIIFDEVASTNDELKKLKDPAEDVLMIARRQSGGRGSKGRSFSCEKGGAYLSLLRLNPCKAEESFSIMITAAVAVVKTLAAFDVTASVKWPNDIFAGGKKICGILIENVFEGDTVARSIVGIGVNLNNPLPAELKNTATSVYEITGHKADIDTFVATLAYNLYQKYTIDEYRQSLGILGKKIKIIRGDETFDGVAKDVLPNGNLLLESGEILTAAEITVR